MRFPTASTPALSWVPLSVFTRVSIRPRIAARSPAIQSSTLRSAVVSAAMIILRAFKGLFIASVHAHRDSNFMPL
jgi:hypothetical protein